MSLQVCIVVDLAVDVVCMCVCSYAFMVIAYLCMHKQQDRSKWQKTHILGWVHVELLVGKKVLAGWKRQTPFKKKTTKPIIGSPALCPQGSRDSRESQATHPARGQCRVHSGDPRGPPASRTGPGAAATRPVQSPPRRMARTSGLRTQQNWNNFLIYIFPAKNQKKNETGKSNVKRAKIQHRNAYAGNLTVSKTALHGWDQGGKDAAKSPKILIFRKKKQNRTWKKLGENPTPKCIRWKLDRVHHFFLEWILMFFFSSFPNAIIMPDVSQCKWWMTEKFCNEGKKGGRR